MADVAAPRRAPGRPLEPIPREVLLAAAVRVLAAHGYGATRLAEVAREVGISKSALAYHFPSKEHLYIEVMGTIMGAFVRLVDEALSGPGPWLDRLDALGDSVVRVVGAQPDVARLILRELTDQGPYLSSATGRAAVEDVLARVVAFLDEGVRQGRVVAQDTRHLAGTIVLVHLGWFGSRGLSGAVVGADPCDPHQVDLRAREVVGQVRRLCGVREALE
jgi:AcrR family transcriptional regulator